MIGRQASPGKTRTCPHCKATILESHSVCPGCHHHLRFDSEAAQRQLAAKTLLRVEGTIRPNPLEETSEYCVVISVRNERGEEVTRHVVGVGALLPAEKRTFTLSVDALPPATGVRKPAAAVTRPPPTPLPPRAPAERAGGAPSSAPPRPKS